MLMVSEKRFDECCVLIRYSAELKSCSFWLGQTVPTDLANNWPFFITVWSD